MRKEQLTSFRNVEVKGQSHEEVVTEILLYLKLPIDRKIEIRFI
jgi:hypothetical protein